MSQRTSCRHMFHRNLLGLLHHPLAFPATLVTESGTTCADLRSGSMFGRMAEQSPIARCRAEPGDSCEATCPCHVRSHRPAEPWNSSEAICPCQVRCHRPAEPRNSCGATCRCQVRCHRPAEPWDSCEATCPRHVRFHRPAEPVYFVQSSRNLPSGEVSLHTRLFLITDDSLAHQVHFLNLLVKLCGNYSLPNWATSIGRSRQCSRLESFRCVEKGRLPECLLVHL